jgi:diadenylate cyclase
MSEILAVFSWRDAVDIALVAAILYRVFVMFRGTRAVQMLVGLAVLLGVMAVARKLELRTLGWLLDDLWSFWMIALVVLFQPELRQALTRVGQGRLVQRLLGTSREERAHVVDEITNAVSVLAARRTGALVIVERATGIRQYAELGVGIDAIVSSDLLVSLFQPASPLHDGAVIIQGSRIIAAGCFLPLSRSIHVGPSLGTRHRAAIGISEEADAVALTVSEETGRVSLAVDGHLERFDDVEQVRARLHELLGSSSSRTRPGRVARSVRRLTSRAADRREAL